MIRYYLSRLLHRMAWFIAGFCAVAAPLTFAHDKWSAVGLMGGGLFFGFIVAQGLADLVGDPSRFGSPIPKRGDK